MSHLTAQSIEDIVKEFALAPVNHPELLPNLLPLIVGAVIIELYFGKHTQEELGWNTSVGNAIIWATTGVTLLLTSDLTGSERLITYFIIGLGAFVGYMNFYHKWDDTVAFIISSAGIVYSLTYVIVIIVKTDLEISEPVIKAALAFIVGVNIIFKAMQSFEKPADDGFGQI